MANPINEFIGIIREEGKYHNQEHQHEVKNPFIDNFESGDMVIMFRIGEKFAVVSKLVSL